MEMDDRLDQRVGGGLVHLPEAGALDLPVPAPGPAAGPSGGLLGHVGTAPEHPRRGRRAAAVRAVHDGALSAFMNAFNPDDLFESPGLGANDALLVESFAVREGVVQPRDAVVTRVAAAVKWRRQTGIKIYGVTTAARGLFDRAAFDYARQLAAESGLDGFGWGEPSYSADAKLPYRQ